MSFRFYPMYNKGNPQLRVFLPNFWMKLISPKEKQPSNVVQFVVPTAMTDYDIRNYLEKIYKVKVMEVRSAIENGKLKEAFRNGFIVKEDDFRRVYVTLPRDEIFEFPNIAGFDDKEKEKEEKEKMTEQLESAFTSYVKQNKQSHPGLPGWYLI